MCRRNAPPTPLAVAPPITPRVITDDSELPEKKELIEDETTADVEFGSKRKESLAYTQNRGTSSLRIPLNTGSAVNTSNTGGLNV